VADIIFEVVDDCTVGVELHHKERIVGLCDIEAPPAEEVILSAVIIVLMGVNIYKVQTIVPEWL
jgi:hypothetical protein